MDYKKYSIFSSGSVIRIFQYENSWENVTFFFWKKQRFENFLKLQERKEVKA